MLPRITASRNTRPIAVAILAASVMLSLTISTGKLPGRVIEQPARTH
jgi:hypothetical protein